MNDNTHNEIEAEIDSLLEDFELKPITSGLGFHHSLKEKKKVEVDLKQQSQSLKNELETRIEQLDKSDIDAKNMNMGELAPFYSETMTEEKKEELDLDIEKELTVTSAEAGQFLRFSAWFIDVVIIFATMLVTFTAIIYFADLPLEVISKVMISDDILLSFCTIGALFYIFYFAFLDKTLHSSLGKNMLKIRVESNLKSLSIFQSFNRACLTVFSIPLLGLPIILRFHDSLTDTKVIRY